MNKLPAVKRGLICNNKRRRIKYTEERQSKIIQYANEDIFFLFGILITKVKPGRCHKDNPDMFEPVPEDHHLGKLCLFDGELADGVNAGGEKKDRQVFKLPLALVKEVEDEEHERH